MINTLLLVDDNPIDQKLYARVILKSGMVMHLLQCLDGQAGLDTLRQQAVDIVLLDVNMPGMSGFDFLRAALAEHGPGFAGAVVVMLTTSLAAADRAQADQFEMVKAYITKPLTVSHLIELEKMLSSESLFGINTGC